MKVLYRWLLYLYPPDIRAEFSEEMSTGEMSTVFAQASEEHRQQGWRAYAKFTWSECGGWLEAAGVARLRPLNLAPMAAGVVAALILQSALYAAATGAFRAAMGRARSQISLWMSSAGRYAATGAATLSCCCFSRA